MRILFSANAENLTKLVTDSFVATVQRLLAQQPRVVVGLCGGRSPLAFYSCLAQREDLPLDRLDFFLVDERLVSADDPESSFSLISRTLVFPLLTQAPELPMHVVAFPYDTHVVDRGAGAYAAKLAAAGGRFDVAVLGLGEDGHVASLFPHHPALQSAEPFAVLTDSPKLPAGRMTATPALLQRSAVAYLFALGESKRAAFERLLAPATTLAECPAALVRVVPEVVVVTDLATAGAAPD